jgi:hypothetical protein
MLFEPLKSAILTAGLLTSTVQSAPTGNVRQNAQKEALASRDYFYVGGGYVESGSGHLFTDQMYVEKLSPVLQQQPYPVVFIHGQAQSGTVCV